MITVVKNMCRFENDISQHLHMRRTGVTISPLSGVCRSLLPGDQGKNRHNAHCSYVIRSHLLSSPRHTGDASLYLPEKIICCEKVFMARFLNFFIHIPHSLIKEVLANDLNDQKKDRLCQYQMK